MVRTVLSIGIIILLNLYYLIVSIIKFVLIYKNNEINYNREANSSSVIFRYPDTNLKTYNPNSLNTIYGKFFSRVYRCKHGDLPYSDMAILSQMLKDYADNIGPHILKNIHSKKWDEFYINAKISSTEISEIKYFCISELEYPTTISLLSYILYYFSETISIFPYIIIIYKINSLDFPNKICLWFIYTLKLCIAILLLTILTLACFDVISYTSFQITTIININMFIINFVIFIVQCFIKFSFIKSSTPYKVNHRKKILSLIFLVLYIIFIILIGCDLAIYQFTGKTIFGKVLMLKNDNIYCMLPKIDPLCELKVNTTVYSNFAIIFFNILNTIQISSILPNL